MKVKCDQRDCIFNFHDKYYTHFKNTLWEEELPYCTAGCISLEQGMCTRYFNKGEFKQYADKRNQ